MVQALQEPGAVGRVELAGDVALQLRVDLVAVAGVVQPGSRDGEDPGLLGQLPVAVAQVEGRQQLAHGEVAGAAEDEEVARGDRG